VHTPRFEAAKKRNSSSTKTKKKQRYAKREQFSAGQGERELRMQTELEHSSVVYRRDATGKGEAEAKAKRESRYICVQVGGDWESRGGLQCPPGFSVTWRYFPTWRRGALRVENISVPIFSTGIRGCHAGPVGVCPVCAERSASGMTSVHDRRTTLAEHGTRPSKSAARPS